MKIRSTGADLVVVHDMHDQPDTLGCHQRGETMHAGRYVSKIRRRQATHKTFIGSMPRSGADA